MRDHYPPDIEQAEDILRFIDLMGGHQRPVFIHCHAGVGRTGTILHGYLLNQGMSLTEAQAIIRAKRIQCLLLSEAQRTFLRQFAASRSGNRLS